MDAKIMQQTDNSHCFSQVLKNGGFDANRYPSPAKLNLFLYINGRREDGYHLLQTLFQFVDYGDWLTITASGDKQITLLTEIEGVTVENNLIYKAAKLLQDNFYQKSGLRLGCNIALDKILPMGGGVGGGSSNAATTLVALNEIWQCGYTLSELANMGLSLGADVPIFVEGYAAMAEGVGEILTPCTPNEPYYLIIKPNVSVATGKIFTHPELTRNTPVRTLEQLLTSSYTNDCEKITKNCYPEVEYWLEWLLQYAPTRLTGTGACIFAEFTSLQEAEKIQQLISGNVESFIAKGMNHSPLHQFLQEKRNRSFK